MGEYKQRKLKRKCLRYYRYFPTDLPKDAFGFCEKILLCLLLFPARSRGEDYRRADDEEKSTTIRLSLFNRSRGEVHTKELVKTVSEKWDDTENKGQVITYVAGATVALWLSSTVVGAINAIPLLPKIMELVGLGYSAWFVYRYVLFKESRKELEQTVDDLLTKISDI